MSQDTSTTFTEVGLARDYVLSFSKSCFEQCLGAKGYLRQLSDFLGLSGFHARLWLVLGSVYHPVTAGPLAKLTTFWVRRASLAVAINACFFETHSCFFFVRVPIYK